MLAVLVFSSWASVTSVSRAAPEPASPEDIRKLYDAFDFSRVLGHVQYLSGLGSRVTGYDGFFQAADYIEREWKAQGLTVIREYFTATTPIVYRSQVVALLPDGGTVSLEAFPMWPNNVNPSPYESPAEGDRLVDGGSGNLEELDGKDVPGSFVLVDFNSRWYWKHALTFKAKGVIFTEPEDTTAVEAVQKNLNIPLNFPRLYVRGEAASRLKQLAGQPGGAKIWVSSLMRWENKDVANLVAVIPGSNPQLNGEVAVVTAFYDSWSPVPQVAPGATDAMGISLLLELPKVFAQRPPERTVWLVAMPGHYQGLWGAREFVERHFGELASKLKMMISLDLSSDSEYMAAYATGVTYGYNFPNTLISRYQGWVNSIFYRWLPELESALGTRFKVLDGMMYSYPTFLRGSPPIEPFLRYFEAEVFTEANYGGGLGFVTTNAMRIHQTTPLDTMRFVNEQNLRAQSTFLWYVLLNAVSVPADYFLAPSRLASDWGLLTVDLQLAQYDRLTDWFANFTNPDAVFMVAVSGVQNPTQGQIVAVGLTPAQVGISQSVVIWGVSAGLYAAALVSSGSGGVGEMGTRVSPVGFSFVVKPGPSGGVRVAGVKPYTGVDPQGYVVDPNTGAIVYGPDTGPFGTGRIRLGSIFGAPSAIAAMGATAGAAGVAYLAGAGAPFRAFAPYSPRSFRYVPVFQPGSIAIVGVVDVAALQAGLGIDLYSFVSHSWYVWRDVVVSWPEAMAFVEPNVPAEIVLRSGPQGQIAGVLNNASREQPDGVGYTVGANKTIVVSLVDAARNSYRLGASRAETLISKMTSNALMSMYDVKASALFDKMDEATRAKSWSSLYGSSFVIWQYARSLYASSFELLYQTAVTVVFFFFLSIPFALLLERLRGSQGSMQRSFYLIAILLLANIGLGVFHPGYSISSNVFMIIVGLALILFTFVLSAWVFGEFSSMAKVFRQSLLGLHYSEIERSGTVLAGTTIGLQSMRRRKLRTALALASIVITVMALTAFTTVGFQALTLVQPIGEKAPYTGLLLRRPFPAAAFGAPLPEFYLVGVPRIYSMQGYDVQVYPHAWAYPPGQKALLSWGGNTTIRGILAITPEEAGYLAPMLQKGGLFEAGEAHSVLLPSNVAESLSKDLGREIAVGSTLNLWGFDLSVKGILKSQPIPGQRVLISDIDQNDIAPPNLLAFVGGTQEPIPLPISEFIIVPYSFAVKFFNAQPNAIQVHFARLDASTLQNVAFDTALSLPFDIYFAVNEDPAVMTGVADKMSVRQVYWASGFENVIIPLVIASLSIFTNVLGSIYERTREISVLSSVGLSPRHIAEIFLIEVATLSFVASYLGYILGIGLINALWNLNLYPAFFYPNVSSLVVIVVIVVMIAATMASSIYPLSKASALVTPSYARRWRVTTKPHENKWSISMPFRATDEETIGVLTFLKEFFEAHSTERAGLFMVLGPVTVEEQRDRNMFVLSTQLQLAPFDVGIIQRLYIMGVRAGVDVNSFDVLIEREKGVEQLWITSNRYLLDQIRKQFLMWRSLPPEGKERYIREAGKLWERK